MCSVADVRKVCPSKQGDKKKKTAAKSSLRLLSNLKSNLWLMMDKTIQLNEPILLRFRLFDCDRFEWPGYFDSI